MTLCANDRIEPDDIQLRSQAGVELDELDEVTASDGLSDQLEHIEREAIIKALEQTRYNKTRAAELLGRWAVEISGQEARGYRSVRSASCGTG